MNIHLSTDGGSTFTAVTSIDLVNDTPYEVYQNIEFEVPVTMNGVNFIRLKYEESSTNDPSDYFAFTALNVVKRGEAFGWREENKVNANCNFDYWHDSLKKTSSSVDFITTDVTLVDGDYYLELIGSSILRAVIDKKISKKIYILEKSKKNISKIKKINSNLKFLNKVDKNVSGINFVILCTPMSEYEKIILKLNNFLSPHTLLTDVGSTKKNLLKLEISFF